MSLNLKIKSNLIMKKWISIIAVVCFLVMPYASEAQTNKFGYVNIQELLVTMPGYKAAEKKLQDFAKQLQDAYLKMQEEYQTKYGELQKMQQDPNANEVLMENLINELVDLEKRMQKLEVSSEEQLMKKQEELLKPIESEVMTAIKGVAKENGFTYIFDSSMGSLLYYPEADNVLPLVKKKLGIQ